MGPQAVMHTLRACMVVAPDASVQASFNRMLATMQADGRTDEEICLALMEAGADGLRNGNWPTN
jgi:hypothetical protein